MGKRSLKTAKFLRQHPVCCFCGGSTVADTVDHIPPRSFFLNGRFPKSIEYPACRRCNNVSSNAEDIARLLAMVQGGAFNQSLSEDFRQREAKYIKTAVINKIELQPTGQRLGALEIIHLGKKEEESFIVLATKIALGLHYTILESIAAPETRMSFSFFTPDKHEQSVREFIQRLPGQPADPMFHEDGITKQFYYRYLCTTAVDRSSETGMELLLAFHFHLGLWCLCSFYQGEEFLGDHDKIVRSPFLSA